MRIAACVVSVLLMGAIAAAQSTGAEAHGMPGQGSDTASPAPPSDAAPDFEVATIKPSDPDKCCARTYRRNGRQFEFHNGYLRWLLMFAYGVNQKGGWRAGLG